MSSTRRARDGGTGAHLPARRSLLLASVALVAVNALHGADHIRQGLDRLTGEVVVGGQGLLLLALIPFVLALRGLRVAPVAAVLVGVWTALAVTASHLAPHWSAFSDPYFDTDLDVASWALMFLVIATAVILAAVGLAARRRRDDELRPAMSSPPSSSWD